MRLTDRRNNRNPGRPSLRGDWFTLLAMVTALTCAILLAWIGKNQNPPPAPPVMEDTHGSER